MVGVWGFHLTEEILALNSRKSKQKHKLDWEMFEYISLLIALLLLVLLISFGFYEAN